jgi:hypothetical protein|nr:MAG TPA: hypothetical protein [Caudoviricetes sp.]
MEVQFSNLPPDVKHGLRALGGVVDENLHERDFIRVWFDKDLMIISRNGDLWTLTYKGETASSPIEELPLTARFLLNYTVKYNVVYQQH